MNTRKNLDARARIIEIADRLFYSEGVRATGIEKIIAMSDVAKATFYHHFESKDVLVAAYLERRDESFWEYLSTPDPPGTLLEAIARIDRLVNHPDVTSCPFLRIASEYPDPDHTFHHSVREHKEKLRAYLGELLRAEGHERQSLGDELLTLIDGALSVRLVYGTSRQVPLLSYAETLIKASAKAVSQGRVEPVTQSPTERKFKRRS
jgi:AcrR family transcriptional regulator